VVGRLEHLTILGLALRDLVALVFHPCIEVAHPFHGQHSLFMGGVHLCCTPISCTGIIMIYKDCLGLEWNTLLPWVILMDCTPREAEQLTLMPPHPNSTMGSEEPSSIYWDASIFQDEIRGRPDRNHCSVRPLQVIKPMFMPLSSRCPYRLHAIRNFSFHFSSLCILFDYYFG
jgi:hypothetical protein